MKKLNLSLKGINPMTKDQMKKINGSESYPACYVHYFTGYYGPELVVCTGEAYREACFHVASNYCLSNNCHLEMSDCTYYDEY